MSHETESQSEVPTPKFEPLLTPHEACALLRCSRESLGNWIATGMPYLRVGHALRFRESELIAWATRERGHRESAKLATQGQV